MSNFLQSIYKWYENARRNLPWRETSDPYKIWLSEIILQQTRVEQGKKYYLNFVENFPNVEDLARANEDQVLKLWQGLGYYSRARNLHYTAKYISEQLNGKFPAKYSELLKLKGVGPYTAAAIASIAYDLPHPTVDGNVYRVFARYFGIYSPIDSNTGIKEFAALAEELMPQENPGLHNQALMEFGALQCVPKAPDCKACPVAETCYAASKNEVNQLPVKAKQTRQRNRYFYYFLFDFGEFIYMEKRTGNDIWKNLYQLPLVETEVNIPPEEVIEKHVPEILKNCHGEVRRISAQKKHILSHQLIHARVIHISISECEYLNGSYLKVNKKDISNFAVPRLMELFLDDVNFFGN